MSERPEAGGGHVRPLTALAFATAAFVALLIFGLGMLSLLLDEDVIESPGLGQVPGVIAVVLATVAFGTGTWAAVRMPRPTFWGAAWTTAATFLSYLAGMWFGAVVTGADLAVAAAVAGRIATTWFGVAVAGAALIASWGGIALVRTDARRPRWPWEDEFDE